MENQEVGEQEKIPKIPELTLENSAVVLPTKNVPLMVNGKKENVVLQKLSTGVRNKIRKAHTITSYRGKEPNFQVDETAIQEEILAKAIIEAPFELGIKSVQSLPGEVSDYLFEQYVQFSELDEKKNA